MKKYFGFVLILVSLSGCDLEGYRLKLQAEQEAKEFENKVKEIEKAKDPYLAYKIFKENCLYHDFRRSDDNGNYNVYLCSDELTKKAGKEEVCQKPYEKLVDSDECILWRRENNGKVTFSQTTETNFDYKRFLPDDTWIQTDADFIWFIENANLCSTRNGEDENRYKEICPLSSGLENEELTSKEKEQRDENIKQAISQDIRNLAMSSEKGNRRLKEEKEEAEQKAQEEEKKKEYEKCLKNANLCDNKKGCRINLGDGTIYNSVIGIAYNGVLVHIEYAGAVVLTFLTGKTINSNVFVYTDKKYTSDSSIDTDVYYEYVGTYDYTAIDGSRQRVNAYKETTIPICKKNIK